MANRFDRLSITDSGVKVTHQGYLRAPVTFTRVGVFPYRKADGTIRHELRPPEEVFRQETLDSLKGIPFTDDHPTTMLDAKNTGSHIKGSTGESVEHDDSHVHGSVTIWDDALIAKVRGGKRMVSCGYTADHEESSGEWNGIKYDVIQRNIIYNHLSSVTRGRAGPTARLRLDGEDAEIFDEELEEKPQMEKMNVDGKEIEVSAEAKAAVEAALAKRDADLAAKGQEATAKATELEQKSAKIDALTEELTSAKAKMDSAPNLDEEFQKRYEARRAIERTAEVVLPKESKMDSMKDLDLMKAVVKEKTGKDVSDKSEAYVQARFDHISEQMDEEIKTKQTINSKFAKRFDSDEEGKVAAARAKMIKDSENAWQ